MILIFADRIPPCHTDSQVFIFFPPASIPCNIFLLRAVDPNWIVFFVPGLGVIMSITTNHGGVAIMIDLSSTSRKISILTICLSQSDNLGVFYTQVILVTQNSNLFRSHTSHYTCPTGTTQRLLAVGSFENYTPLGQTVEVRSFHLRVSVDTQIAIHIVSGDK